MPFRLAILSLLASTALLPQTGTGITTNTTSTSRTQTLHTTSATAEVNHYLTRLTARVGVGPLLYDQSFNAQLADPSVQAAIQQARALLAGAGANSISGPNQQSGGRVLTGTSQATVVTRTDTTQAIGVQLVVGPGIQLTGDRGLCTGLTTVAPSDGSGVVPSGCPGGTPFTVLNGNQNINTNLNTQSDIFQTVTTTSAFLTSQTYELNGTAAPAPPATPAPPSFWLSLAGLAATGLFAFSRRSANS